MNFLEIEDGRRELSSRVFFGNLNFTINLLWNQRVLSLVGSGAMCPPTLPQVPLLGYCDPCGVKYTCWDSPSVYLHFLRQESLGRILGKLLQSQILQGQNCCRGGIRQEGRGNLLSLRWHKESLPLPLGLLSLSELACAESRGLMYPETSPSKPIYREEKE